MSKDAKGDSSVSDKFKKFLKKDKKTSQYERKDFIINDDVKNQLGSNSSISVRIRASREILDRLKIQQLEKNGIGKIWLLVKDFFEDSAIDIHNRKTIVRFLIELVNIAELDEQNRFIFFQCITEHYKSDDNKILFEFLRTILKNGENVEGVEENLQTFLREWIPYMLKNYFKPAHVYQFLEQLIKHNSAYLHDEDFMSFLVVLGCHGVLQGVNDEEIICCFTFLEAVITYSYIPENKMNFLIMTLSRLSIIPALSRRIWNVIKKYLYSGAANTIVDCMTTIIQTNEDREIVRGCIILLSRSIWSTVSCPLITISYSTILSKLEKASLSSYSPIVVETAIGISNMIYNKSIDVYKHAWKELIQLLHNLCYHSVHVEPSEKYLHRVLKEMLLELEVVVSKGDIVEDLTKYYDLPECLCCEKSDNFILSRIDFKIFSLRPEGNWISDLVGLSRRYFLEERRIVIRLHMLEKLRFVFDKHKKTHGVTLCEKLFITQLNSLETEKDNIIRDKGVEFLIYVVLSFGAIPVMENLQFLIHTIAIYPFTNATADAVVPLPSNDAADVIRAVDGLMLIFKKKMWKYPVTHAIRAYHSLMLILECHYRNPQVLQNLPEMRKTVFEMLFDMRANESYNLGFPNCPEACIPFSPISEELDREIGKYTPYIVVEHKHSRITKKAVSQIPVSSPDDNEPEEEASLKDDEAGDAKDKPVADDGSDGESPVAAVHLSLTKAAQIVLVALKKENEWPIVQMILEKLPAVLEGGSLILSKDGNNLDYLSTILCTLVSDNSSDFSERFLNAPEKFNVSDFNAYIYPVLARLPSYHEDMGHVHQRDVIKVLQFGILSKSSPICVSAMTTCVLEMRTIMVKHLRDVMIALSKISATIPNAHPTLEFLSTLLHLPRVYNDFSPDQYMSVFAICIPYTNPFKFNHYIVSLAYHVIAMWFLKCRLTYRKQFVGFIAKNLNTILVQESSDRARCTGAEKQRKDEMVQFHGDLRETLVDFMARYCFDSYSPTTKRTPVGEMLVESGQKQMWLVGTRIITITTSGCSQRPMVREFCDKCYKFCNLDRDSTPAESMSQEDDLVLGRGHKSEFNRSISHETRSSPQSKDDTHVENPATDPPRYMSFLGQDGRRESISKTLSDEALRSFKSDPAFPPNLRSEIKQRLCACWCRGWAEILIRQPTGDVSWMMRVQNEQTLVSEGELLPISELSDLFLSHESSFMETYQGLRLQGATSAESDLASESGLTAAQSNEWSGSALSSGNNSGTSSELKLNQDSDKPSESQSAVSYSLSDPEVNLKLAEGDASLEQSSDKGLEQSGADAKGSSKQTLKSGSSTVRRSGSIVGCPSPSSAPFSGTRHASAAQMKSTATAASADRDDEGDDPSLQPMKRGRGHAISEMNPASRVTKKPSQRRPTLAHTGSLSASVAGSSDGMISFSGETSATTTSDSRSSTKKPTIRGISPSAIFLQLYYQGNFGGGWMRPIFLPTYNADIERSIKLFDLIKPQENHKIGVIYVGPNQRNEIQILKNSCGSSRYLAFLGGLGVVHDLKDLPEDTYLGGYDRTGVDGDIVYMWTDQIMQVLFHVATVLPNSDSDEQCINKKRHIGNDYVTIVYNDSKYPYKVDTIKSHFNHSIVEIVPGDHKTNLVVTHCKPEVGSLFSSKPTNNARMVSDISLPVLARQLAVHSNLASMVSESLKDNSRSPYSSNWLERLRRIRKLREKVIGVTEAQKQLQDKQSSQLDGTSQYLDFNDIIDVERGENKDRGRNRLFTRR